MTLSPYRGLPAAELARLQSGAVKAIVAEFGDGIVSPVNGQRSGYLSPWPGHLSTWYLYSTIKNDISGLVELVPVSVVLKGYHKRWADSAFVYATSGADPTASAVTQATGTTSGWSVGTIELADQWEWELTGLTGGGSKIYFVQLLTPA